MSFYFIYLFLVFPFFRMKREFPTLPKESTSIYLPFPLFRWLFRKRGPLQRRTEVSTFGLDDCLELKRDQSRTLGFRKAVLTGQEKDKVE